MPCLGMVIIPCDMAEKVKEANADRSFRSSSKVIPANSGCRNED